MAVLSSNRIRAEFQTLFRRETGRTANIRAAKYYLTLASTNLILPSGKRHTKENPRSRPFSIKPGQAAFVSSEELMVMPPNLIGIIGPRFNSAEHGALFFGGMLVDPGYGHEKGGEPLSFHIANLGNSPIELRPGKDEIASIAFFEISDPVDRQTLHSEFQVSGPGRAREELMQVKKDKPVDALALVEDLGRIRARVDRLAASVKQVVLFGVIVLAATLLAAVTTAIFSVGPESDQSLHQTARTGAISAAGSNPSTETLALTLGIIIVGAVALVLLFYLFAWVAGKATGITRSANLRNSS